MNINLNNIVEKLARAESKSQQRLMGMAYAYKTGELKRSDIPEQYRDKVIEVAKSMTEEELKEYAETKHKKNMPEEKEKKASAIEKLANTYIAQMPEPGWRRKQLIAQKILNDNTTVDEDEAMMREVVKNLGIGAAGGGAIGAIAGPKKLKIPSALIGAGLGMVPASLITDVDQQSRMKKKLEDRGFRTGALGVREVPIKYWNR